MNTGSFFRVTVASALLMLLGLPLMGLSQNKSEFPRIVVHPSPVSLNIDEETILDATVYDAQGETTRDTVIFFSRARQSVSVTTGGKVKALKPGSFEIMAVAVNREEQLSTTIPVEVAYPPVENISLDGLPDNIYTKTSLSLNYTVTDVKGINRDDMEVTFTSSDPSIAEVSQFGRLKAKTPGTFTLTATTGSYTQTWDAAVKQNPVSSIDLSADNLKVRTGDVIHFDVQLIDTSGNVVNDVPVTFSFIHNVETERGEGAAGKIARDGRFVANRPGQFTIVATSGNASEQLTVSVKPRDIQKDIKVVGHGKVLDKHTSDLWVWEGVDGRDYAVTGTWGAAGEAYFWDVTDPAQMQIVDTVTVDARTVNDVKVSDDGQICVITREGASDRKNGIVILDVRDPRNVKKISEYNEGLTGGVHNAFIWNDHVFAVNNGRRYDIINIEDPANPRTVSRFELDTPGHSVHDVWVENGIAYSSNWDDGVQIVDVGSTQQAETPEKHDVGAGSPENPVKLGSYSYPSGWNHAAFPFKSQSTGDFYVVAGDEAFPNGLYYQDTPTIPAGWIHFIKFENGWDQPKEVARYEVPEAGTHNFWVKDDTLYVAYYNAGLRVVDISGELMGDLYDQGREIAKFLPIHHEAIVPNAAMTWGPQPHKGYIFLSDWNSGLWALKLEDDPFQRSR